MNKKHFLLTFFCYYIVACGFGFLIIGLAFLVSVFGTMVLQVKYYFNKKPIVEL